jgi:hypothetical protein
MVATDMGSAMRHGESAMKAKQQRKIVDRHTVESLIVLIGMGRARVVKEHTADGPEYAVFSASGTPLGIAGERWKYMFEAAFIEHGAGDGLFEGCSQTVAADAP